MKTIEDRAKARFPEALSPKQYAYQVGACEQRELDIIKAQKIVTEIVEDILARSCETWSEYNRNITLAWVRDKMENYEND